MKGVSKTCSVLNAYRGDTQIKSGAVWDLEMRPCRLSRKSNN